MEIKVYLHRTKKKNFAVCEAFTVEVDLDKLPENVKNDIDYINQYPSLTYLVSLG